MRRALVVANWKMNGTEAEAAALVDALLPVLGENAPPLPEVGLAPPFTSLRTVGERIQGTRIALAAQNLHSATHGAFTGEISAPMLAALGVRYVIVGHSERRRIFGESDEEVGRKAAAAAASRLVPILCVGEEESDRMSGRTLDVIARQLRAGIEKLDSPTGASLVIAYEPVWAIGTGRTASPEQASEAHGELREALGRLAGSQTAEDVRIIYGGSVTPEHASRMLSSQGIDGALVGGASLVAGSFARIVAAVPSGAA